MSCYSVGANTHTMPALRAGFYYGHDGILCSLPVEGGLLRSSKTLAELHEGATGEIHAIISKTADAYEEASHLSTACTGASYHARFLRELVAQDIFRSQQQRTWDDGHTRSSRRESTLSTTTQTSQPPGVYPQQMLDDVQNSTSVFSYPISPTQSSVAVSTQEPMQVDTVRSTPVQNHSPQTYGNSAYPQSPSAAQHPQPGQPQQSDDLRYWNNMFRDLGFGDTVDQTYAQNLSSAPAPSSHPHPVPSHQNYGSGRGTSNHQQPYAYHHMHSNAPGYGL
ncbi:hypothetical protein BC826DRAFT_539358 [Russula brevipes]|nr:hypothetical protein BC826DRAFT_539358 [Russula brevipes]